MNTKRLKEVIEENNRIEPEDDDAHESIWNEMYAIMSENLEETIEYLDSAPAFDYEYICSVFDILSEHFQSEEFIECLERNFVRTGVDFSVDIKFAKEAIRKEINQS